MLKLLSIAAALVALATGPANAQQEAVLHKMQVAGTGFDLVIATPKFPAGATYCFHESPDALIIHLVGGELALGFEEADKMMMALDTLRQPIGAFRAASPDGKSRIPIAVYIVPSKE